MPIADDLVFIILIAVAAMILFRTIRGRIRFPALRSALESEGILHRQRRVWTRFNFPLIKKIVLADVYLTDRRLVVFHWLTRKQILQVPVGPRGCAGTDKGRFQTEKRGKGKVLLVRAAIRGGGRIRFHLADPEAWLGEIIRS